MTEFVKVLEVAIDNGDKEKVMTVLDNILEYAIAQDDVDLVERTIETIKIMKEEEKEMKEVEIKDVETNQIGNALITDQGSSYLVEPYMIETDSEGNVSYRYYKPYVLEKKWEGYEYTLFFQEIDEETMDINKEETEMITKEEKIELMQEEAKNIRAEELERDFNHIQEETEDWVEEVFEDPVFDKNKEEMKTMNGEVKDFETGQIERALITDQGETYLIKPYMLESDGSIKTPYRHFPSYTLSKSMEGFEYALYLQEEEETTIKMDLQFFGKRGAKEKKVSEGHTLALTHIEILDKQRENLLSFLEGRKEDELTSSIEEELSNVESSIKRWGSIHSKSLHAKVKEGAIKLGRSY